MGAAGRTAACGDARASCPYPRQARSPCTSYPSCVGATCTSSLEPRTARAQPAHARVVSVFVLVVCHPRVLLRSPCAPTHRRLAVLSVAWVSARPPLHVVLSERCRPCEQCAPQEASSAAHCLWQTFRVAGGSNGSETHVRDFRFRCPERFRASAQDSSACSRKTKGARRRFEEWRRAVGRTGTPLSASASASQGG